jgi:hypothetical protein
MAKQFRYSFVVTGTSTFPADMLRYDACWPCDSETVDIIMDAPVKGTIRRAVLMGTTPPTDARWASFGWRVVNMTKRLADPG